MSKGNRKRRRELGLLPTPVKCAARSSRTGEPCKNSPINGAAVCRWHGGAASQVVRVAKERLALGAGDAVSVLMAIMLNPKATDGDRLRAALALFDRVGLHPKAELDLDVKGWEEAIAAMVVDVDEGRLVIAREEEALGQRLAPRHDVIVGELASVPPDESEREPASALPMPPKRPAPGDPAPPDYGDTTKRRRSGGRVVHRDYPSDGKPHY
jgi:hypothetical protein